MVKMEKELVDTVITPDEELSEELELAETDNDEEHNSFIGADESNLLEDGVPGYQTTGQEGTDDQIEEELEQIPGPMNTPKPRLD
ncbi:hypothetical protein [Legionella israelensis]|uniref:Uncharacterized protein n=1 Tax=Legionella israelensis TaxID=454 RepID=A0A0W0W2C0_9GAMM|nr:hypothetical protein [Legionella israelensis]KTD26054.1 hypothetical protein Lisr_1195 [Legionella israelensis]QBS10155.1 hypothetical protein E4T55_09985 [Legionella israelensis]QDP73482.1 hypothetical protein FOG18_13370 [Legionella israelensis]SCY26465.1 hypothetical protein SAMN02746069_01827 [Legionella israelensis DSM 19235]STX59746.1 Uncharacterised protein [Legionella israelensis]